MNKLICTLITILILTFNNLNAQCMLRPISLKERLDSSTLVVEGKVISEYTRWDDFNRNIYTIHKVEILRYFKGTTSTDTVEFCQMGGFVGNNGQETTNTLHPEIGSIGIFTLIPTNDPFNSTNNYFEPYAGPQGLIEYHRTDSTASAVFDEYSNYKTSLLDSINVYINSSTWNLILPISWGISAPIMGAAPGGGSTPTVISTSAVISSFTPTTSYAGRGDTITITGSGFGATQGTSYVQYRDADQQTTTYSSATLASNYISWSDTEIKMYIPDFAGTGLVKVTDGTTTKSSSGTLTINYAIINITSSSKDYFGRHYNTNTNGGYSFQFYTGFTNTNARGYFGRSMNDWRCATNMDWDTSTTASSINVIAADGVNIVRNDIGTELSAGVLGVCTSRFSGCTISGTSYFQVTELDVCVDDGTSWYYGTGSPGAGNYDYYSMIIHEVGHGHQMGHVMTTTDFMYPAIAANTFNHTISTQNTAGGVYMTNQAVNATSNQRCVTNSVLKSYSCTPSITLSTSVSSISEATTSFTITATNDGVNSAATTVNLAYSGTATGSGTDYTGASSITIPAWSNSASITVTINNDVLDEADESIIIDISTVTNGVENGTQQKTVTILDNDPTPTVTLAATASAVTEAAGTTSVTATLSAVSGQAITVGINTSGSATGGGTDYTLASSISIPAGSSSGSITFTAVQDAIYEGNELAILTLGTLTNVSAGTTTTDTVIITDDETLPVVTLSSSGATVAEAAGTRTITATQNISSTFNTKVYLSKSGTATNNVDYTLTDSITIPSGSTSASITLTAIQDAIYEGNETIVIDISSVTNGVENGTQQSTVTITDDEVAPIVSLTTGGTAIAEASGTTTVIATQDKVSVFATKVYISKSGTSTNNTDYTLTDSITIPAGSTTANITIAAVQDVIYETDETVIIDISSVTNGTENGTQQKTVTVTDDETMPTLSMAWSHTSIGETASDTSRLTVTQSGISAFATNITLGFGNTATLNTDYSMSATSISIAAGSTTASSKLTVIPDVIYEGNDFVGAFFSSVTNATGSGGATVTINDDDAAPTVTLSSSATSIAEASGTATITATLSAVSGLATKVYITKTGSAINNTDYTLTDSITIPAGSSSGSITLTAVQDALYEGTNDSVIITISSVTNGTINGGSQSKSVKITDDDAIPTVSFVSGVTAIGEGNINTSISTTLSAVSGLQTKIYLTKSGTATNNTDYTMTDSITIAAGSSSGSINLTSIQDVIYETGETVIMDISSIINGTENGTQQKTVTITDDEGMPSVSLTVSPTSIVEASGTATLTATQNLVSAFATKVYLTKTGTATNITDYTLTDSISIAAGSTTGTINLTAVQDTVNEGNETVIVDISSVTNGTENGSQQIIDTIIDDDNIPLVTLTTGATTIAEAAGTTTVTATLSKTWTSAVKVYITKSGTGTNNTDYALTDSITVPIGSTTASITLTAVQDALYEGNETIIVDISSVTNGSESGTQQQTVNIIDDDASPTVSITSTATSFTENAGTRTLTIALSAVSGKSHTINLNNTLGVAIIGTDYSISSTSVTIPAGSTSATVSLTAIQDTIYEGNETTRTTINSIGNGGSLGLPTSLIDTIIDDDPAPTVSLTSSTNTVAEAAGTSTITATLSRASAFATKVYLSKSGTATNSTDYTLTDSIIISAGSISGSLTFSAIQDAIYETNETTIISISSVSNGTINGGSQTQTITITDDEAAPTVSFTTGVTAIGEGNIITSISTTLSAVSGLVTKVYITKSGTATNNTDYTLTDSITIAAGSTSGSINLASVQDLIYETNETVIIDISSVTNGTENGVQQKTVTITDDEAIPSVSLTTSTTTIAEAAGLASITATQTPISAFVSKVYLSKSGTASNNADYSLTDSITIPIGSTSASIALTAVQDTANEGNETVIIDISSVTNGTENGTQQVTDTIIDDDNIPVVTLTTGGTSIAEAAGTTTVTATLSKTWTSAVKVYLSKSGTTTNNTDYTLTDSITVPIGSTSASINLTAVQDVLYEGNETIIVDISSVTNGIESGVQQKTVSITDDDAAPTVNLSLSTANISEASGTTTVTATLSAVSGLTTFVTLGNGGTATNIVDYTYSSPSIIIPAGSTAGTMIVTAVQDTIYEGNETIITTISAVTNGTAGTTNSVTSTIIDDDPAPSVTLSASTSSIAEAAGTSTVTATLSAVSGIVTKVYLSKSGTATNSIDYTLTDSIIISAGSTSGNLTLTAVQDTLYEGNETAIISISSVTNGTISGGTQSQTISIIDDDIAPSVSISSSTSSIAEAAGTSVITMTLSKISGKSHNITLVANVSSTATDNTDCSFTKTFTILAGSLTATTTLTAIQDTLYETNENIIVQISSIGNGGTLGSPNTVTITIVDDDLAPTVNLSSTPLSIAEAAGNTTVTATLSAVSGLSTTINLSNSGTATSTTDYTKSSSTITIPAGSTTGSITVTAVQDVIYEGKETIITSASSFTNATAGTTTSVTDTIVDDDAAPSVTLSANTSSIAEAAGTLTVTATLSAVSGLVTKVYLSKSGTATNTIDYTLTDSIIIPAGSTNGNLTLTAIQDAIYETNETVIISISSVTNGTINGGTQTQTVSITDDESLPLVTLTTGTTTIAEAAGSTTVTASQNLVSAFATKVYLTKTGTATNNTDYTLTDSITIPAGSTSASINITAVQDLIYETNETVIIDISSVTNGTENGIQQKTVTITDDEAMPSVTLSTALSSIFENAGTTTVTATQTPISAFVTKVYLTKTGTATNNTDYSLIDSILIPAGSSSAAITITAINDATTEGDETVIIDITSVMNGTINGTQQKTIIITEALPIPTVSLTVSKTTLTESNDIAQVTATLSNAYSQAVTVNISKSGTATITSDYVLANTITIPAGSLTASINIVTQTDAIYEGNETVIIDISTVTNGTENGVQSKTITITDNNPMPSVSLTMGTNIISENNGTTTITATLTGISTLPTTVNLTYTGTATISDYSVLNQIIIPANQLTASINISSIQDVIYEGDETIIADISSVVNATENGVQQKTLVIVDDESIPTVSLVVNNTSIAEAAGSATISIQQSAVSTTPTTIVLSVSGSANSNLDYSISSLTIIIPAGSVSASASIGSIQDILDETDETIIIDIASVTNALESGVQQKTITILDDDLAQIGILSEEQTKISIYPNPSLEFIIIDANKIQSMAYEIFDLNGRKVMDGKLNNREVIQIQELSNGEYVIRIKFDQDNYQTLKFTKE